MLNTIIVPLDGSDLAERALPYAESLAADGKGKLVLVRAALAHMVPGGDPVEEQLRIVAEAEKYLQDIALKLTARGFEVETAVPYGQATGAILDEIRIRHADMVVMATHGRTGASRLFYGSVAEGVLGSSPVPILLVRAWHDRPASLPRRMLVPLDGSTFSEAALPVAGELAKRLGASVTLMEAVLPRHVAPLDRANVYSTIDQELDAALAKAEGYLVRLREGLWAESATTRPDVDVRVGAPVDAIIAASADHDDTMIVMATHGRTGLSRVLLGSVAGAVLRHGRAPLLLIRPSRLEPAPSMLARHPEPAAAGPLITLTVSQSDLALIRMALETLGNAVTRHEHLRPRIEALLAQLPPEAPTVDINERLTGRNETRHPVEVGSKR